MCIGTIFLADMVLMKHIRTLQWCFSWSILMINIWCIIYVDIITIINMGSYYWYFGCEMGRYILRGNYAQNIPIPKSKYARRSYVFYLPTFGLPLTKKRYQISLSPIQFLKHHERYTWSPVVVPYAMFYAQIWRSNIRFHLSIYRIPRVS